METEIVLKRGRASGDALQANAKNPANTGRARDKEKQPGEYSGLGVMVEPAGIEPASASTLQTVLHT
jgi:hypothetical protein